MTTFMNRRTFLSVSLAGASTIILNGCFEKFDLFQEKNAEEIFQPPHVKIHTIYLTGGAKWADPNMKVEDEIKHIEKHLKKLEKTLPNMEFVGDDRVNNIDQAHVAAGKAANADAILLIPILYFSLRNANPIIETEIPVVVYIQPFSTFVFEPVVAWQKKGKKVLLVASREINDVGPAISMIAVPARMKKTRILHIGNLKGTVVSSGKIKETIGPEIIPVNKEVFFQEFAAVPHQTAVQEAEQYWINKAQKIIEPQRDEIIKSARTYIALKNLIKEKSAQAIAIDCLSSILPYNKRYGYPCLAFSKLEDTGMVTGCEGDIDSTLTKLIMNYAFGKPGFISEPIFETSNDYCIFFHCTAPTKMDGPDGRRAPFIIRNHAGDDKGASLEVEMKIGQEVTSAKLINLDTMLTFTGEIKEIPDFSDRGCRTQISVKVPDADKLLRNWGGNLISSNDLMHYIHRVVFYGNHLQSLRDLANIMDFEVIEEVSRRS